MPPLIVAIPEPSTLTVGADKEALPLPALKEAPPALTEKFAEGLSEIFTAWMVRSPVAFKLILAALSMLTEDASIEILLPFSSSSVITASDSLTVIFLPAGVSIFNDFSSSLKIIFIPLRDT